MNNILEIDPLIKAKRSDLLEPPVIIRVSEFDNETAKEFSESMSRAHNTGQIIIPIIIDSSGGQVYSLLSMIANIKSSKLPVATIATGKAMSCGAVLLSCGAEGHRYMDENAVVMIHDIAGTHWGKNEELKASAKQGDKLQKQIFGLMAKNCRQNPNYFLDIIHDKSHAEWYLTPQEAKKHNIINHIKVPEFRTKISVATVFG